MNKLILATILILPLAACVESDPLVSTDRLDTQTITKVERCFEEWEYKKRKVKTPVYSYRTKYKYVTENGKKVRKSYKEKYKSGYKTETVTDRVADYGQQEITYEITNLKYTYQSGRVRFGEDKRVIKETICD